MRFGTLISLAAGMTASCSNSATEFSAPTVANCPAGAALIFVGDGFLQTYCGCNEGEAVSVPPAQASCTVPVGTQIHFNYSGTHFRHQIISIGEPSFISSPIIDPQNSDLSINTHVVSGLGTGTYAFEDSMNTQVAGKIIVQ